MNKVAKIAVVVAMSATAGGLSAPAFASGTSSTTHGCYSTWGSTGASSHCYKITGSYGVRTKIICQNESDDEFGYTYISKGSTVKSFGQVNCFYKANSAHPQFK